MNSRSFVALACCVLFTLPSSRLIANDLVGASFRLPCKYSVRDVAFVNVHGKSWQLNLIKPDLWPQSSLEQWNKILREKLSATNVGYAWHEASSDLAKALLRDNSSGDSPRLFLTNDRVDSIPIASDLDFETQLLQIVHSPVRKKLGRHLTDSLCVFLLIKGNDRKRNAEAQGELLDAIGQIEKTMWMMEKASSKGPVMVSVDAEDPAERLTLQTIGCDPAAMDGLPAVAIMFGQFRRLGDVIRTEQIKKERLVALASICGSDCECALDRDWLYGNPMVHHWDQELARLAENELDFDPKSAFVMAEVAQILQKNSKTPTNDGAIRLGSGLVIHDLDQESLPEETSSLANALPEQYHKTESPVRTAPINAESKGWLENEVLSDGVSPTADRNHGTSDSNTDVGVPWYLFAVFAAGATAVIIYRLTIHT